MHADPRLTEGFPEPLGSSLTAHGVNFAVHAPDAEAVEICLFDPAGEIETARIVLSGRTGAVHHGHVADLKEGQRYGLRAHGPFAPERGQRFNPNKLLLDPYALSIDRPFGLDPAMFSYRPDDPQGGASFDIVDSAPVMPKAVVIAPPAATPPGPAIPWDETVIYELHVKGFTQTHPDIPEAIRGTFAGLAHPAAIGHLKRLGVTTVELLPVAAWIDERHLPPLGLANYWGYNPIALMTPDPRLAPGGWAEVATATGALADAGIETLLDVVFNHTGESDALGPTVCLRGLDNAGAYRLNPDDLASYVNDAGTGDILALDRPAGVRLAMDAMRAWRRFGGVAGFRFDLATVMGRRSEGFDARAPLLAAIDQDPELRSLKRIAEPWDCGPGGYQLGRFPAAWGEWNDRFRDDVRGFWRGDAISLGALASRLAGSQDVFDGRRPSRSVNFVVAHDGFTLADLVSYTAKRNLANNEQNRDGTDDNRSWNNGVEGPTDDPTVLRARRGDQRALLATLLLARGTPMLAMGSETGQTQGGNNNAYAQDNATTWLDWAGADAALTRFASRLTQIRREHPALRADRFLTGGPAGDAFHPDVAWTRADGTALHAADWDDPKGATLVMTLASPLHHASRGPPPPGGEEFEGALTNSSPFGGGGPRSGGGGASAAPEDRVAVILHRGHTPIDVVLPAHRDGMGWTVLADSADEDGERLLDGDALSVAPRCVVVVGETSLPTRAARGVDDAVLSRLSQAAGIAPDWWGVDGIRRIVSPDTQKALLAAMALPATTGGEAKDSLHRLAEDHDLRPLPFALVVRADRPGEIVLPCSPGEAPPRTWLTLENEEGRIVRLRAAADSARQVETPARDGRTLRGLSLTLPALSAGRYRLEREDRPGVICRLIVAPGACYAPPLIASGRRGLGLSAQLYALRRQGDQGIGDLTTLGELSAAAAAQGAAILGINPLHALFSDRRDRASPYYASDRRFLDPIYLDLRKVPFVGDIPAQADTLAALAEIDYPAVWALKAAALEASFRQGQTNPDFIAFAAAADERLVRFATFEAITETRPGEPWRRWPADLQDARGAGVAAFAAAHAGRVRFHLYLQWLCERQLADAARQAGGLAIGLCRDLAIGSAPDGAEIWAEARMIAGGVSIGAPPDPLGPQGQVWGLPPFDPWRLKADGYLTMSSLFAANMRHAGALRIDHVLGLARQFWVPHGAEGKDGAYVRFPLDDLLGALALESGRAQCLVVGEDLGTVPEGLRGRLHEAGALSYRVLPFERRGADLIRPDAYPRLAWACVATHDLPPLAGWWLADDVAERLSLGLITAVEAGQAITERQADRAALIRALGEAGLVDAEMEVPDALTPDLEAAIHAYVALTPSALAIAQIEDLAGERVAVNLPGTDVERPNWRRRLARPLETLFTTAPAPAVLAAMRAARGS